MKTGGITRKEFLTGGAAALGGLVVTGGLRAQSNASPSAPASRKVMHVIGYSHIDAAWLWPWRDGADLALTTLRSALNRLNENPGMCYSHSSMAHYRWVQRADPAMFAEIQHRIREGRWEVVGGWPVEPDCNLPSTESFVRHCLYGQAYAQANLGVSVRIGFNPDAFGHAGGLPTILHVITSFSALRNGK
jgi:alpha-mannosidase